MNGLATQTIGAIGAIALGLNGAHAGILDYTSQVRTVDSYAGEGGGPIDVRSDSAPDFAPWAGSASANFGYLDSSVTPPQYTARSTGSSQQMTTLGSDRISAAYISAGASGFGHSPAGNLPMAGNGSAHFEVSFDLAQASDFSLDGTMSVFGEGTGLWAWTLEMSLRSGGNVEFSRSLSSGGPNHEFGDFADSGTLEAGSWTMSVQLVAVAGSSAGSLDTDLTSVFLSTGFELVVPAPGSAFALAGVLPAMRRRRASL